MTSLSIFFWLCFIFLVKFRYWSKFHVNIITDSGVMTISFYKTLTRNPEIGNIPVWVLPNIWRLRRVGNTRFGMNLSSKMLLNAAKYQGYSFYRFWLIKRKPTEGVKSPLPPPRLGLNFSECNICDVSTQNTKGYIGVVYRFPIWILKFSVKFWGF